MKEISKYHSLLITYLIILKVSVINGQYSGSNPQGILLFGLAGSGSVIIYEDQNPDLDPTLFFGGF